VHSPAKFPPPCLPKPAAATSSSATPSVRQLFRETDDNVAKKTLMALDSGLTPLFAWEKHKRTATLALPNRCSAANSPEAPAR